VSAQPQSPTDNELVAAYRGGEVRAFEELHRRHVGSIYRLVVRTLGDPLLAEDIAQETFIRTLRTLDKIDASFNFGGWLHTVAQNLCRDELRRRRRDPRVEEKQPADKEILYEIPAPAGRFDPVVQAEAHDLRRQVHEVAQRLPEKYRLVLTLRELQGFSYRRIAKAMKISESAVETLVYRARLRFKEEFVGDSIDDDMDHRDVLAMLKPYLAGKLRRNQAEAIRNHLAHCVSCSRKLPQRKPSVRRALTSEGPLKDDG
jgi:RNA polymerase sigma-70 factor (ECF subfamily)